MEDREALLGQAMWAWEDLQAWKRMNEAVRGHGASEVIQECVLHKEAQFADLMNQVAEMHARDCTAKLKRVSESYGT